MHNRNLRIVLTLLLLAVYAPLMATLDLHHNHSHDMGCCRVQGDAYGPEITEAQHAHNPCPVLLLTQSHAPLVTLDLIPDITTAYLHPEQPVSILSRFQPEASQRGPPLS